MGAQREAAIEVIRAMVEGCSPSQKGLRVDCIAELAPALLWIDVGIVHPTARSKLLQSLSFVRQHDIAEKAAAGSPCNNAFMGKPTPPVHAYQSAKDTKYKAMVEEAAALVRGGKRARARC